MPFSVINDINAGRKETDIGKYNPFLTNRYFSFFPDTLYFAQLMNLNPDLEYQVQYLFFINTIRSSKRFTEWLRKEQNEDYDAVREWYGFSHKKTQEALSVLSRDQIIEIKNKQEKGE